MKFRIICCTFCSLIIMTTALHTAQNKPKQEQKASSLTADNNKKVDFESLKKSVRNGDVQAAQRLYKLGESYEAGDGVLVDHKKACDCYLAAAPQSVEACNKLCTYGKRYEQGLLTVKNEQRAIACYAAAACGRNGCCPEAQCNAARCALDGVGGLSIVVGPSLDLLYEAAAAGNVEAMIRSAYCKNYLMGEYDPTHQAMANDYAWADYWYCEACKKSSNAYVEAWLNKLEKEKFAYFLHKCRYCSNDFVNLDGTKQTDYVEFSDGRPVHVACLEKILP